MSKEKAPVFEEGDSVVIGPANFTIEAKIYSIEEDRVIVNIGLFMSKGFPLLLSEYGNTWRKKDG